jgi:transcriptional regulator with XRE-family HTH domain
MSTFGDLLRDIRMQKGFNQDTFAEMVGVSQAAVSQFEKGTRVPTPIKIKKIAEILGVAETDFFPKPELERNILMRKIKGMSAGQLKKIDEYVDFITGKPAKE